MEWHTYRLSMSVDVDITASVANERFKRRLANSVRAADFLRPVGVANTQATIILLAFVSSQATSLTSHTHA
jgi:hypothetical protein